MSHTGGLTVLALALAVLAPAAAQSPSQPEVRIALTADPASCHVQQLVQLRLQVRIDEQALRTQLLQLFQQQLELPIQVDTRGLERDPRLLARGSWSPLAGPDAPSNRAAAPCTIPSGECSAASGSVTPAPSRIARACASSEASSAPAAGGRSMETGSSDRSNALADSRRRPPWP